MSKLYRRKTNCKEPATGKKATFIYATPNPSKIFSSAFIFSKTFTNHPRLTNLKQNGEIHDEYTNKIKLFARWIDLLESCFYQTLRALSVHEQTIHGRNRHRDVCNINDLYTLYEYKCVTKGTKVF